MVEDSGSVYAFEPARAAGRPAARLRRRIGQDVAAIFYTSGTTGFPKGAMHTHENVLANVETAIRVAEVDRDIGREYRTLVVVPLFHVTGCHSQMLPTLRVGGATVIDVGFDGARMIETLAEERITACVAVPAIYYYVLHHPQFCPSRSRPCAGRHMAARRSRLRSFIRSRSGSQRARRQRLRFDRVHLDRHVSARTSGRPRTPTRSGSPRRMRRSPWAIPIRTPASARS